MYNITINGMSEHASYAKMSDVLKELAEIFVTVENGGNAKITMNESSEFIVDYGAFSTAYSIEEY